MNYEVRNLCKGCKYFNANKTNGHGRYCEKHDAYIVVNELPCDDYIPHIAKKEISDALLYAGFLCGVSGYMDEIDGFAEEEDDND